MDLAIILVFGLFVLIVVLWDTFTRDRPRFHHPKRGTVADPDVAAMVARQYAVGKILRETGKSIYPELVSGRPRGYGKNYVPAVGKADEKPNKSHPSIRRIK